MNKKILFLFSVMIGAVLLLAIAAYAGQTWKQRLERADTNQDGKVDRKEWRMDQRWRKGQRSKANTWWENRADTNNDGVVDSAELSSWRALEKNKLDANKDGSIDAYEKRRSWIHSRSKVNSALEAQYDADSDGWLDSSEAKELLQDRYVVYSTEGKGVVDSAVEQMYDTNEDGVIDAAEARAMSEDAGI